MNIGYVDAVLLKKGARQSALLIKLETNRPIIAIVIT
jgi:hypothetical protein